MGGGFVRYITGYRLQNQLVTLLIYSVLILGTLTFVFPFVWMVATSLKPAHEVMRAHLFPKQPTLESYRIILQKLSLFRWYFNTFLVAMVDVVSVALLSSVTAYGLSKYRFRGQQAIFVLVLSTMMVPTEMLLIPWYIGSVRLGWVNTFPGIIFPGLVSASAIFIMRQFMQTIPDELLDAARVDGMSELGLLWKIVLPLARPALAAVCVFTFMGAWNGYLWPLIIVNSPDMYTLQVGLSYSASAEESQFGNWSIVMALSTLISIPGLIVFSFLHRQMVQGIVLTGMKG
jgi:multiple sugar transport system permease protein